jgi:DNA mismatch repair protein MutS
MSGKSTYIRQVAIIVLMAQIGSFVPASKAEISIADRIFTRVGASDDLASGRSTFMVEMEETANILNNATANSLVILDEIGRGTSTYDGVSIAYAITEYLLSRLSTRTLFATHYHELIVLADRYPDRVQNLNVVVEEDTVNNKVLFLRKIERGGTNKSYGVYVAEMAGLPDEVIQKAKEVLSSFEQGNLFGADSRLNAEILKEAHSNKYEKESKNSVPQLDLFGSQKHGILEELEKLDVNKMTPMEAFDRIVEWSKILK